MKAQKIYDIAMALMDEYKDNSGVDTNSTKDYLARTPSILTMLNTQVYMELSKVTKIEMPTPLTSIDNDVELEDDICTGILPEGLAGYLLANEDVTLSNFFSSSFLEKITRYATNYRKPVATIDSREDVYGSLNITND